MIKALVFIAVCFLGLGVALWDQMAPPPGVIRAPSERPAVVLTHAPDIIFDTGEAQLALADFSGRTVLVNIWATWCPPCIFEIPQLLELARTQNLTLVLLSVDKERSDVDAFFDRADDQVKADLKLKNVIIAYDPEQSIARDTFGTKMYPETYIITPQGMIKRKIGGIVDWLSADTRAIIFD